MSSNGDKKTMDEIANDKGEFVLKKEREPYTNRDAVPSPGVGKGLASLEEFRQLSIVGKLRQLERIRERTGNTTKGEREPYVNEDIAPPPAVGEGLATLEEFRKKLSVDARWEMLDKIKERAEVQEFDCRLLLKAAVKYFAPPETPPGDQKSEQGPTSSKQDQGKKRTA